MNKVFTQDDFPMRMNIHFCLEEPLSSEIKSLNKVLVTQGSDIDFSKEHIPHLTVLMGNVPSLENYTKILKGISEVASETKRQKITVTNPYIVTPKRNFLFMDVAPKNRIKYIKYAFFNKIKKYMRFDYYGMPKVSPHITLGYIDTITDEIGVRINEIRIEHSNSVVSKIGISPASDKGTCLKEVFVVDLVGV